MDEIINSIPFDNLSSKEAERREFSPYAQLAIALKGWIVFDLRSCEKVDKFELYVKHHGSSKSLEMIKNRTHPSYKFISRETWNKQGSL